MHSDDATTAGVQDFFSGQLGTDAWLPMRVFVFGLDTEEGRPGEVVTLSAIPKWDLGWLSTDPSEGASSVPLPISN